MSAPELVAAFDLDRVTHAAAGFDRDKLDWLNGEWIRRLELGELVSRVEPLARARYGTAFAPEVGAQAVRIAQERAVTLVQIVDQMGFLFVDESDFRIEPESWVVLEQTERVAELFDAVLAYLEQCEWTIDALAIQPVIKELGLKPKKSMPALYAAVEGVHRGLPLFDSMYLLGRDRTLARLRAARQRLA
jgi:glutamyl-tRNA synthetase